VPLAVSSAARFSLNEPCREHSMNPTRPLCEFRLRLEPYPAKPSRPPWRGRLLSWALFPYSTHGLEGPLSAGSARPLRSALGVWSPPRRLPPFKPLPVLFHTGGAPGIAPSELSPPARYTGVSTRMHPRTVSLSGNPPRRRRRAGPLSRGSWVLTLARIPRGWRWD
jgi:hypothetical protein